MLWQVLERLFLRMSAPLMFVAYFRVERFVLLRKPTVFHFRLDDAIPLVPGWTWIYGMMVGVALVPLFLVRDLAVLRRAALGYAAIQAVAFSIFVLFPVRIVRPEAALVHLRGSFPEWVLGFVYSFDGPVNSFPSLHVASALFMGFVTWRLDRPVGAAMLLAASAIAVSVLFVKQHFIIDAVAGLLLGWVGYRLFFASRVPPGGFGPPVRRLLWLWVPGVYLLATLAMYGFYRAGSCYPWPTAYASLPAE